MERRTKEKAKDRKMSPQVLKVTSQSREDDKRAPASLNCHHTLKTKVNEYDDLKKKTKRKTTGGRIEKRDKVDKGFTAVI